MTISLSPIVNRSKTKWYKPQNNKKLALNSQLQTYQILPNDDQTLMFLSYSITTVSQGMMSHSLAIKERMKQFAIHFYLKLLYKKMFQHRILLLLMAGFVTLTNGYLLSSFSVKTAKHFNLTLPEPLKINFFNMPDKPRPRMPPLGRQQLDRPHHGKPRLTLQSKTRKDARMMWWKWRLGRSSGSKLKQY